MKSDTELSEAARDYAAAYAAHYTEHDLPVALQCYLKVMASHPGTPEAGYCRAQIQNVVNAVVPDQERLDAQVQLALAQFEREDSPDALRTPLRPLAP